MATGYAGFTSLGDGSVVYATTGLAADEYGGVRLFNLSMPGIRGLVGSRTFHGPDGSFTLAEDSGGDRLLGWSWLNIDDRVGFVVRDSQNPVRVRPTSVVLSSGPGAGAAGMVVEGYSAQQATDTARAHAADAPSGGPAHLRASLAGGCLSLFNLSDQPVVEAVVRVPHRRGGALLFLGTQTTAADATAYPVTLGPAEAKVEPPRFRMAPRSGAVPGLRVEVRDARRLTIAHSDGGATAHVSVTVTSEATGESPSGSWSRPASPCRCGSTVRMCRWTTSPGAAGRSRPRPCRPG